EAALRSRQICAKRVSIERAAIDEHFISDQIKDTVEEVRLLVQRAVECPRPASPPRDLLEIFLSGTIVTPNLRRLQHIVGLLAHLVWQILGVEGDERLSEPP